MKLLSFLAAEARRQWCGAFHDADDLRPAAIGHGAVRCKKCGATFTSVTAAGKLCLETWETSMSTSWLLQLERTPQEHRTFEAERFRIVSRGKAVRSGAFGRTA
jgi:hypothetical protein